jgi:pantoate--beta-alanine ligase
LLQAIRGQSEPPVSCSVAVASILVNPLQFDQKSDYDLYPRALEEDVAFCAARGLDYVFVPSVAEI